MNYKYPYWQANMMTVIGVNATACDQTYRLNPCLHVDIIDHING